jgi:DNA-binding beta-propeller fold protein YncE
MANAYLCCFSNPLLIVDAITGAALGSKTFTGGVSTDYAAVSPNGAYLAVAGGSNHVQFMNMNTLALGSTYTIAAGNPGGLAWHPDSSKVWVLSQHRVYSVTPSGTIAASVDLGANVGGTAPHDLVVSPDGSALYCTGQDGVVEVDTVS